jgi:two-component system, OmpR family, sensor histidine kinase BaeS
VRRLSLRGRLIIAFVGIAVLAPILATLLSGLGVHRSVDDYLEKRAQEAALSSAGLAESAYTRGDDGPGWEAGTLENLGRELDLTGFDYRLVDGDERLLDTTPMVPDEGSPVVSTPVHDPDGNVVGTLELYASDTPRSAADDALRGELDQAHVLGVAIAALVAVLAAILVAGRMSSPLRRLAAAARGISQGGSVPEPLPRGSPEVRDLEASLVGLAVDLERQQRARRQLAQDLSHELRTPLMLLQGRIEAMQDGVIPFDADGLDALHTETLRLSRLVGQIERLTEAEAKAAELEVEDIDLDDLAREAHDALAAAFEMRNLRLELDARRAPARGDRDAVRQIVLNLLSNALKYAPQGAPVRLSTALESGTAVLRVRDEGRLSGGERRRVFERFYRGREVQAGGSGAGLGLTIARELAQAQGGSIELEPTSSATSFLLRLPTAEPPARSAADARPSDEPRSREDPVASHPSKG